MGDKLGLCALALDIIGGRVVSRRAGGRPHTHATTRRIHPKPNPPPVPSPTPKGAGRLAGFTHPSPLFHPPTVPLLAAAPPPQCSRGLLARHRPKQSPPPNPHPPTHPTPPPTAIGHCNTFTPPLTYRSSTSRCSRSLARYCSRICARSTSMILFLLTLLAPPFPSSCLAFGCCALPSLCVEVCVRIWSG